MKTVVALVAFLAIFVPLNSAFGGKALCPLKCHKGSAFSFEGTDSSAIGNCSSPRDQYCIEATCSACEEQRPARNQQQTTRKQSPRSIYVEQRRQNVNFSGIYAMDETGSVVRLSRQQMH
uniref:Uncharacterized protein n=1 Tax=Globodera rostochiensis TaxID=31243 RepID=A0A914HU56_GLORO